MDHYDVASRGTMTSASYCFICLMLKGVQARNMSISSLLRISLLWPPSSFGSKGEKKNDDDDDYGDEEGDVYKLGRVTLY